MQSFFPFRWRFFAGIIVELGRTMPRFHSVPIWCSLVALALVCAGCYSSPFWDAACQRENRWNSTPGSKCAKSESEDLLALLISGVSAAAAAGVFDTRLKIFRTDISMRGDFGGIAGADAVCAARASALGYPGTFNAMLGNNGAVKRIACVNAFCSPSNGSDGNGWVLKADTEYFRAEDGAPIGTTTDKRIFTFPLTNAFSSDTTVGVRVWTYLAVNWTPQESGFGSTLKCMEWTSPGADMGLVGSASSTSVNGSTLYAGVSFACSTHQRLFCVQQ